MDAVETAHATKPFVSQLPARFMMDGATYARGGELGYDGLDFYAVGRGGVLGDVDADVVTAAFIFFAPQQVREYWDRARQVGPVDRAAIAFAECASQWGRDHLDDETDHARLASLLARVVESAHPGGASLFAGWRALGAPDDSKGRVLFFANALRELRGARHGAAVLAAGISPDVAVHISSPQMAAFFGWAEPIADLDAYAESWKRADAETDSAFAPAFLVLDADERAELTTLAQQAFERAH
jgi:hypothetical protein